MCEKIFMKDKYNSVKLFDLIIYIFFKKKWTRGTIYERSSRNGRTNQRAQDRADNFSILIEIKKTDK